MNRLICIFILILVTQFIVYPEGTGEKKIMEIIKTYNGMVSFGYNIEGNGAFGSTEPRIIKSQETYENFIAMIPEYAMTRITPAPPNEDPLLEKPDIDFSRYMMLVIFSHDVNMFIRLRIEKVEIIRGTMVVSRWYEQQNPDAIVAKIVDYGFYYAVVVPRFDGEITFKP